MTDDLEKLIACPKCDALHQSVDVGANHKAKCSRCGSLLISNRDDSIVKVVALSFAVLILLFAAVFFPFLQLDVGGVRNAASILDTVEAFSFGFNTPLTFAVAGLIIVIPAIRVGALAYALMPLAFGRPPWRFAVSAFRTASRLKPWAMAEVFVLGVTVALVKIAGMAAVTPGPAFWAFCALVIIVVLKDNILCNWSIWKELDTQARS